MSKDKLHKDVKARDKLQKTKDELPKAKDKPPKAKDKLDELPKAKDKLGAKARVLSPSLPSSPSFTLSCPSCGKQFTRPTKEKAFRSIDRHCRSSKKDSSYPHHGSRLDPSDYGLTEEDSKQISPSPRVLPEYDTDEDEDYNKDMEYSNHEEPEQDEDGDVPDGHHELKRALMLFGMGSKRALQFSTLMGPIDIQNAYDLMETADKMGWRKDQRNRFMEHWFNKYNIFIPDEIAKEIGGYGTRSPQRHRRSYRESHEDNDPVDAEIQKTLRQLRQVKVIKSLGDDEEEYSSSHREKDLEIEVTKLESEIESLKMKIEFRDMIDERVKPLEEELRKERDARKDLESQKERKPFDKLTDRIADEINPKDLVNGELVKDVKGVLKAIKVYLVKGKTEAPPRDRMGPSTVADIVAEASPETVEKWGPDIVVEDAGAQQRKQDKPRISTVVSDDVGKKTPKKVKKK